MPTEELMIRIYCLVDEFLKRLTEEKPLRSRGFQPKLSDSEVITMEIVGEFLGHGHDKTIWEYFHDHWHAWFPDLGCRENFCRQSANLWHLKETMQQELSHALSQYPDIHLFDGFPIPTSSIKRCWNNNPFWDQGAVGYCASKDLKYFGFKGHLLTTVHGLITGFSMAKADIDERDMIGEVVEGKRGMVIADKGLIRPFLKTILAEQGIDLQTPLRSNMKDDRPKWFLQKITSLRRTVETVIGQLTERFNIQKIKAKDTWHLSAKVTRKLLAHTACFFLCSLLFPDDPLQFEQLQAS